MECVGRVLKETGLKIVPYEDCHADAVTSLVLGIQNGEAKIGLTLEEQPDLQDIGGYFLSDGGGFWVALREDGDGVDDGAVIGCIGLQKRENGCGILKKFFVAKPFRGRESGVAAALFKALMDHAARCRMKALVLDTPSVATRSHGFYRRAGFVRVTGEDLPVAYDFPDRDSLLFMKVLD